MKAHEAIRRATAADVPELLAMVRELAAYERAPREVVATEDDFVRRGFGDDAAFHALIAEHDGAVVGFALYVFGFSTWRGTPCLYLEDLYVRPAARKLGLGRALMSTLAGVAVDKGCERFVLQVLDWNEPAIRFYESLGARVLREWLPVRIEGQALLALAQPPK